MNRKNLYKSRGIFPEISADERSQKVFAERQEKQLKTFWSARVPAASPVGETVPVAPTKRKELERLQMLYKWKEERKKKLEDAKKKQKPIFKVGIVHRTATGSPLVTGTRSIKKPKKQTCVKSVENAGVVTRATAKRIGAVLTLPVDVSNTQKKFQNKFCKIELGKKKKIDSLMFRVPNVVSKLSECKLTFTNSPKIVTNNMHLSLKEGVQKCCLTIGEENTKIEKTPEKVGEKITKIEKTPEKVGVKITKIEKTPEKVGEKITKIEKTPEKVGVKVTKIEKTPEKVGEKITKIEKTPEKVGEKITKIEKTPEKIKKGNFLEIEKTAEVEVEENKENLTFNTIEIKQKVTPEKVTDDYQPIHFSPFVTVRSNKKSGKKAKKSLTINVEEVLLKEDNEFKCRIFSFRKYIQCETKRLLEACEKWKINKEFEKIPTDVEGDIDAVIGKTKLLTSDKFVQFKGLIDKCENGDPFIKLDDLVGFQDWVAIEVEKLDEEFCKLEKQKCSNWKVESIIQSKQRNFVPKKTEKKHIGKSNIRSHILAARKVLKESNAKGSPITELPKLNEAIKLSTPSKTPTLLKQVLTSETKKKYKSPKSLFGERRNSGLEIMIATQKNKLSTSKSPIKTDYEIFIEENNKPSRSILKKTPKPLSSTKGRVTFKKLSTGLRLSESYFKPTEDSPDRTILKDLGNLTSSTRITRSKARLIVNSDSQIPSSPMDPFIFFS